MTRLLSLTRKQTVGFSTLALVLATGAGIALAAPAAKNQSTTGASTDQRPGPGNRGHDPFARWDQDNDGKLVLKELPARPQAHLATIDTNKDGTLTREEFNQGRQQLRATREKELDTNQDGKVTDDERKAGMKQRCAERFTEDDKNHDGFLTADELPGKKYEHLSTADTNKDKKLSKSEIETAFANGTLGPRGHGHDGNGPKGKGPMNQAERKAHLATRFNEDDTNHDGYLVQTEAPQRWAHLKTADANNDSKVSLAELQSAFESGKMRPPQRGMDHKRSNGRGHGQGQQQRPER